MTYIMLIIAGLTFLSASPLIADALVRTLTHEERNNLLIHFLVAGTALLAAAMEALI